MISASVMRHRLPAEQFEALAAGFGGPSAIRSLRLAKLSRNLLLIRGVLNQQPSLSADVLCAVGVLAEAQRRIPDDILDLFIDPWVGYWVANSLRQPSRDSTAPHHPEELVGLAAVAAARAGLQVDLRLAGKGRRLFLPTLGEVRLHESSPTWKIEVRAHAIAVRTRLAVIEVPAESGCDAPNWRGIRHLEASYNDRAIRVGLDDTGVSRDCFGIQLARRLRCDQAAAWQRRFRSAWALLAQLATERADEIITGLTSIVPLASNDQAVGLSATAHDAFGAMAATFPGTDAMLAVTLVHEFQHSKLDALMDLVPLYEQSDKGLYYSPWRRDPRPIGGLLHGAYAFTGVADMWRRLRKSSDLSSIAERQFALAREQVAQSLGTLDASYALTPPGRRLVGALRETVETMFDESIPLHTVRAAKDRLSRDRVNWRTRNRER
jgi:HEXXH motif-containing protein